MPRPARAAALWATIAALLLATPTLPATAATNDAVLSPSPLLASGMQEFTIYAPALAALITMLTCAGVLLTLSLVRRSRVPDEEID